MRLTREALLAATTVPTQAVDIPELGGAVVVRGMTGRERTLFEKKFVTESRGRTKRNFDAFREQIIVFCCVDPQLTEDDVERLANVRADIVERIATVAMQLSGLTDKDADELGQVSGSPAASTSSSSVSPASLATP